MITPEHALTLHLVLTYKWFDDIAMGIKSVEYRKMTPYWKKRIWDQRDRIDTVTFSRGYTRRWITSRVTKIDVGPCPYKGWTGNYYRVYFTPHRGV